jgi:hypothetical protein
MLWLDLLEKPCEGGKKVTAHGGSFSPLEFKRCQADTREEGVQGIHEDRKYFLTAKPAGLA